MRILLTLTSLAIVLTLCSACDRKDSASPATTALSGATAEVTPDGATFTIPVEERPFWRWHVESTPFNAWEYDWSIHPKGINKSFGFSVWKKGDAPPRQGNLSQLIEAGQGTIWEPTSSGGGRMVGKIGVTAVQQGSAMEMVLLDQPLLKEILEKRPPAVEVVIASLDTAKEHYSIAEQRYSIAVKYRDR